MAVSIPFPSSQVGSRSPISGFTEQQTLPDASHEFTFRNCTSPVPQLVLQVPGHGTGVTCDLGTQQNWGALGPTTQPVADTACSFELQEVLQFPPWEEQLGA